MTINGIQQPIIYLARGILTLALLMAPSATWTAYANARDTSGNKSETTATLTGTAAAYVAEVPGPPATVTLTGTRTGQDTWQANVSWSAGTGGTGTASTYEVRYYKTASGAGSATILPVPTDNRVMLINGLLLATGYTINVRSVTAYGDRGGWSTGSTLTFSGETPGAPTISSVSSAKNAITFSIGKPTTGTGLTNIDRYIVGMAWYNGATLLGKEERIITYAGDPTGAAWMGVIEGATYKFAVTALTKFGDIGTASAQSTYTVPLVPPAPLAINFNGSFETPDPNNPTQPDGWTISVTSGAATTALDNTQVYSGKQALKIVRSGGVAAVVNLVSRRFDVQPGDQLFVTGAIYGVKNLVACGFTPNIIFYRANGTTTPTGAIWGITTPPGASAAWGALRQTGNFNVPADAVQAEYTMDVNIDTGQTTVYIDNFSISMALDPARFPNTLAPIQKGTSNPASPVSADRNYRTDIGRDAYYDGARWLNIAPEIINFVLTSGFSTPFPNTLAAGTGVYVAGKRQDIAYWIERGDIAVYVNTTNNATNYWTIALIAVSNTGVKTTLASVNTSAGAANAYLTLAMTSFSGNPISTTGAVWFEIDLTKTGTPGSVYVYPQVTIREIMP